MALHWQLYITSQPLRRIFILPGKPAQLAVSETRQKIRFYDLKNGAHYQDLMVDFDIAGKNTPEAYREGLNQLKAPNGVFLPVVDFPTSHLYTTLDGSLRLIQETGLTLEIDDQRLPLDIPSQKTVAAVDLDRDLGTIAAVTDDAALYVYQQQTRVSQIHLDDTPTRIFIKAGGNELVLIYPEKIYLVDTAGTILRQCDLHYTIGSAAMSPGGRWLAVGDADYQLIRLYNHDLIPVRQQHAVDLITTARKLQLFTSIPAAAAPISALDITDNGILAFGMAGVLCVAKVEHLTELPQPRSLF